MKTLKQNYTENLRAAARAAENNGEPLVAWPQDTVKSERFWSAIPDLGLLPEGGVAGYTLQRKKPIYLRPPHRGGTLYRGVHEAPEPGYAYAFVGGQNPVIRAFKKI